MHNYKKLIQILIIICFTLFVSNRVFSTPTNITIYFYSPEVNINNFASLKIDLDTYLANFGDYEFQPFTDMATFENFVTSRGCGLVLVSSRYYTMLKTKLSLKALLVGVSKEKSTYRKVVVVKKSVTDFSLLKGASLASSGNEEYTTSALRKMVGSSHQEIIDSLRILVVPKDIDALMTVGFGMSQAALTSEKSLEKLLSINPNLYNSLKKIYISDEYLLPVVAVFHKFAEEERKLIEIIEVMGESEEGVINLKMFGLDGWRRLTRVERELLER